MSWAGHILMIILYVTLAMIIDSGFLPYDPFWGLVWIMGAIHFGLHQFLKRRKPNNAENISYPTPHRDLRNLHAPGKKLVKR